MKWLEMTTTGGPVQFASLTQIGLTVRQVELLEYRFGSTIPGDPETVGECMRWALMMLPYAEVGRILADCLRLGARWAGMEHNRVRLVVDTLRSVDSTAASSQYTALNDMVEVACLRLGRPATIELLEEPRDAFPPALRVWLACVMATASCAYADDPVLYTRTAATALYAVASLRENREDVFADMARLVFEALLDFVRAWVPAGRA